MKQILVLIVFFLFAASGASQVSDTLLYLLSHDKAKGMVRVTISFANHNSNVLNLVIPRSAPGTYEITDYSQFVEDPVAYDSNGATSIGKRGSGSYFIFSAGASIQSITYKIDLNKMETTLPGAYSSSRTRSAYMGILGYSVFGFIKEFQNNPIQLTIQTDKNWPIFSTLAPDENMNIGMSKYVASSFDALADAQYMAGPDLQVWHSDDGPAPFYLTMYSESPKADKNLIGKLGLDILKQLNTYFGFTPMPHYVMHIEYLIPISKNHSYGFWMEHMNSMTGFSDTSNVITKDNFRALSIAHHMGHSWIPLRSYGEGYRPFTWEVAPLIETIWFNEGFIWYAAGYEVLGQDRLIPFFNKVISDAPDFLSELSLRELSLLGSTQYGQDFRIGRNLFSRGGLFAHELNMFIQEKSGGNKSFKDAILAIYNWSQLNNRAFKYDEFPGIISSGIGIDITEVWIKWNKPL